MAISFEEAVAAQAAGDFATAEQGYLAHPTSLNALYNLATLYRRTDRLAQAEAAYRVILGQYPDMAATRRSLGMCLLAQRRYAEAWPLYEARRTIQGGGEPIASCPEWQGEPLAGRRLVVVMEQGLGDQIMFSRYLPVLQAEGAEVVAACDPRTLARLFERSGFATAPFLRPGSRLPAADYWVFMCSVPLRLGRPDPAPAVYLSGQGGGQGIGVVTRGNPTHQNDAHRSLGEAEAAALLALGRDLSPAATGALDFLETAEIIAGLNLVITVDTSVAHLAASMGKPCWVLLPRVSLDWRWNDGERSDWYPGVRLFRQAAPHSWPAVIDRVRDALDG
jgi:hypothetical protein